MNAQTNAAQTNKNLTSSLEKLSSGLRINKAADDASGMAIADKLRTQASSLGQGISNANSANALIQIADKAMSEQSNILDIVKTKLIQASTATTSEEGREAIRKDVTKLLSQLDNIAEQTNYNGINLLNEAGKEFNFQVGEDSSFDIGMNTAYAANTAGLGSEKQLINDETAVIDYDNGVYLDKTDTQISVKHDENTAATAAHDKAVLINGAVPDTASGGTVTMDIAADDVSHLTFDVNGGGTLTLTTTDAALMTELDSFAATGAAAQGTIQKSSDGVYTITTDATFKFGSDIDISNLTVSGVVIASAAAASDQIGVVTDEFVSVTKTDGTGKVSVESGEFLDGTDTVVTTSGADTIGMASGSAEGLVYGTNGPILEEGTVGVQYDSDLTVGETAQAAVTVDNQNTSEDSSYTVNAETVKKISLAADATGGVIHEVLLSSNDAAMIAKLDEMADNNSNLTKINSGAYTFETVNDTNGTTAVLDFGDEGFDISDLTISTQNSVEAVTFETEAVVNVTKNGNQDDATHIQLSAATTDETGAVTAGGNLVGASSEGLAFSESLAALKALGEDELTSEVANKFMSVVDNALNQINSVRADFGSTQNQLDSATRNMMVTQTNIKAAESVIRDVDYAAESANFNKQNIIAQAGTYAMSQANAMAQNVQRLLQ
jgi:flagellin